MKWAALLLVSGLHCVVNVVFFLLGDSPASEFYVQHGLSYIRRWLIVDRMELGFSFVRRGSSCFIRLVVVANGWSVLCLKYRDAGFVVCT
jgi:hypothetical protein